ncbi:hypothetical protein [Tabrizicola sp.]|uniref:hypothetical protein n=1 Tax=Tabrizicola sp. TaxID=2005166 RepID=UPI003F337E13
MVRLIGFLVLSAITAGGALYFDYQTASRSARESESKELTVVEYLGDLPGRIGGLAGTSSASGLPRELADMLPAAPKGWTVRPTVPEDVEGFLPKNANKADKAALAYVGKMSAADGGSGVEAIALTYERGERKVLIKATRYPNGIFTGSEAHEQRFGLQMTGPEYRGTEFMSVRGLDVAEDLLPEGFRGRYFMADVGGQIHLRVLAPKRMADSDLLPFFETLHVKAMNASVVDKSGGLGEVPVIVLASALDGEARDAYVADVAARASAERRKYEASFEEAKAKVAETSEAETGGGLFGQSAEAPPEEPARAEKSIECDSGNDGVKRCKVVSVPAE